MALTGRAALVALIGTLVVLAFRTPATVLAVEGLLLAGIVADLMLAASVRLAGAYYAVGRLTDAGTLYREVVSAGERVLAPGHPLTRSAREGLTSIPGE